MADSEDFVHEESLPKLKMVELSKRRKNVTNILLIDVICKVPYHCYSSNQDQEKPLWCSSIHFNEIHLSRGSVQVSLGINCVIGRRPLNNFGAQLS